MRYGQFAVLNDVRAMPVQSPEVAKGLEFLRVKRQAISRTPMATVTQSQLVRMQADRVLNSENSRVFTDWDQAMVWLDEVWGKRSAIAA